MATMIRVVIIDDHQIVRQGLRTFLTLQDDIEVVGEAADGAGAVDLVKALAPDVVLMDLMMPKMDGITATRQIRALGLKSRVIALTSFTDNDKVLPAIQAGACSYLLKDVSPEDLVEAVRSAYRGETRLNPEIATLLVQQVARAGSEPAAAELTEREKEVTGLVAQGLNNHDIAARLFISEKTVKTHVSSILSKLDLDDRTQLAIYAIKHGLAGE